MIAKSDPKKIAPPPKPTKEPKTPGSRLVVYPVAANSNGHAMGFAVATRDT